MAISGSIFFTLWGTNIAMENGGLMGFNGDLMGFNGIYDGIPSGEHTKSY